jgi:HEAT repeat protein
MKKAPKQAPPKESPVVPVLVIGVLVIIAALAYKGLQFSAPASPPAAEITSSAPAPQPTRPATPQEAGDLGAAPRPSPPPPGERMEAAPADPKDLVSTLAAFTGREPITAEQARKWKESLQQLIRQGAASVPALQQFLAQNLDANFAGVSGAAALGYNSLRSALLDALGQIGGPEATQAMLQTLQSSIFPTDIATLAKTMEAQAPGQYQQAILDAVRQQLNLGAMDQLGGANVLPLYQVLAGEAAHGANVSADLTQYAEKWPYYSAIALAALPDGAGVASLTQMAQGATPGNQAAAVEALAGLAPQNPQALNTLLGLAKSGELSDPILAQMAPYLAGRQNQLGPPANPAVGGYLTYHLASGNQDFSSFDASGSMTQAQISQGLSMIDQVLQAVPSTDSATVEALQEQRNALAGKLKP